MIRQLSGGRRYALGPRPPAHLIRTKSRRRFALRSRPQSLKLSGQFSSSAQSERARPALSRAFIARGNLPRLWYETGRIISDVLQCRTSNTQTITRSIYDPGSDEHGTTWQESEQGIFRKMTDTSLVIFNDVGLRRPSEAAYEVFLQMLDVRVAKPTFFTSNLDPDQIRELFDDRIASRLLRGSVINAVGDDRRSEEAKFVRVRAGT